MESDKKRRNPRVAKILVFFICLTAATCLGLMWFLRPQVSQTEKRKLAEFPSFSLAALADGSWFSQVETWYADTFPGRDVLVEGNDKVKELYGSNSEQLVMGNDTKGEEIPEAEEEAATLPPTTTRVETTTAAPKDGTVTDVEKIDNIYVSGDSGYGLYYFVKDRSERYAAIVNECQQKYDGKAEVYSIIAPINSGIMLSDELQKKLHGSDQNEATEYMYGRMNDKVRKVRSFDTLRQHVDEYIYFRTDHHWTALGAYYCYTCFAKEKGVTPHKISDFEHVEFPNYLGTFYSSTKSSKMAANPDTVHAYIPMGTNDMKLIMANGNQIDWKIVYDVSNYKNNAKYGCFVCSDEPISWAVNPQINDGSACVVIKDSYGNAFIPFLIDHYQTTYWVDFRHWDGSLSQLVDEKGITDIIFLQNMYNTSVPTALDGIQRLVES